jgi:hypothetical protein
MADKRKPLFLGCFVIDSNIMLPYILVVSDHDRYPPVCSCDLIKVVLVVINATHTLVRLEVGHFGGVTTPPFLRESAMTH